MIKACVFDLDGTLIDSLADLYGAGNHALRANGYPEKTITEFQTYFGDGVTELVKRSMPEYARNNENVSKVLNEMLEYYSGHLLDNTLLYDDVVPLVQELQTKGIRLFIYTNKHHHQAVEIVRRVFGEDVFEVVGLKPGRQRKPDTTEILESIQKYGLSARECAFIGDAPVDMMTAKNAGMLAVGAAWGYHATKGLIKTGADIIAYAPLDILALFNLNSLALGNQKS